MLGITVIPTGAGHVGLKYGLGLYYSSIYSYGKQSSFPTNYYSPEIVSGQGRENISRLIRSFQTDRPVSLDRTPNWDLNLVLNSLRKAPYEPAEDSDFLHLTYKTIFLVAFASGKRRFMP